VERAASKLGRLRRARAGAGGSPSHPHNKARKSFLEIGGATQPAPAPRFSRSASDTPRAAASVGADTRAVLSESGFSSTDIDALLKAGAIACAS